MRARFLTFALSLACAAQAQHAYAFLQELSDTIGPRLTGSSQDARAAQWALRKMQAIGLQNVHLEPWTLQKGWQRGPAHAELTAPFPLQLQFASYGWTGATPPGGIQAQLILVKEGEPPADWSGKILFLSGPFPDLRPLLKAAQAAHAAAVIAKDARPGVMLTHTDPAAFGDAEFGASIPVLDVAAEQHHMIERMLTAKVPVRMQLVVDNRFTAGPVESANVSGELTGSEHPEEVVLLGAHLDSWDLGTGALDDGAGVAAVLGAMESLAASGSKPRRTIRVVLFTGEEQGLLGSRAWVRAHAAELPNVVCSLVVDWGQGAIQKLALAGRDEFAALQSVPVVKGYLTYTDAYSFTMAGVPGLAFAQAYGDYATLAHSAADTLDKVDAAIVTHNAEIVAKTAREIANAPLRLGAMWSPEKTTQKLAEDHQKPIW